MAERWFCVRDGHRVGPLTFAQLRQMAVTGLLHANDMVMCQGTLSWRSAHTVPGLLNNPEARVASPPYPKRSSDAPPASYYPSAAMTPGRPDLTEPHHSIPRSAASRPIPRGKPANDTPSRVGQEGGVPVPAEALALNLADEHGLGRCLARHSSSVEIPVGRILGVAVLTVVVVARLASKRVVGNWLGAWEPSVLITVWVTVLTVTPASILFVVLSRKWRISVFLFEQGLVRVGEADSQVCRWAQVRAVRFDYERPRLLPHHRCELSLDDGALVCLENLARFRALADSVRRHTYPHLLRRAKAAFRARQPVAFGPAVSVDRTGLRLAGGTLPWSEVEEIMPPETDGYIRVRREGKRRPVIVGRVEDLPNYFVLLGLVGEILGEQDDPTECDEVTRFDFGTAFMIALLIIVALALACAGAFL